MPTDTEKRRTLFEGVIRFAEGRVEDLQRDLDAIAAALDAEIRAAALTLELGRGRFLSTRANLGRLADMRRQIDEAFAASGYLQAGARFFSSYPELEKRALAAWTESGLPEGLTAIDFDALRAISGAQFDAFANIGRAGVEQVKRALFLGVAGGGELLDFSKTLRAILLGTPELRDRGGRGMFRHAATLARTAVSELHATMTRNLAEQAGIDRFEYVGPLVDTSRPFCIARKGKVFTRSEIDSMDNEQTGAGTVLVARGGFNCNHQWMPLLPAEAEESGAQG